MIMCQKYMCLTRCAGPFSSKMQAELVDMLSQEVLWSFQQRVGCSSLTGAERREWMGMGVAGIIIDSYYML